MSTLGFHRVISPSGVFPQAAHRLDTALPIHPTELLLEVRTLNIDSNSYRQIREMCRGDSTRMRNHIIAIVADRGKMHNPVTGSGGMMIGCVAEVGRDNTSGFTVSEMIASLISLTLTPLKLERITYLDPHDPRIDVDGYAILFQTSPATRLPVDIEQSLALSILDVCGAPKLVQTYSQPVSTVLVLGGGKSGILAAFAALDVGCTQIAILERNTDRVATLRSFQLPFNILEGDAKHWTLIQQLQDRFNLTIDCLNVPDAEMAAIVATDSAGMILYFNTATSFTQAALGAEGVGKSVKMVIGNGYYPGHADYAFELVRRYPALIHLLHD